MNLFDNIEIVQREIDEPSKEVGDKACLILARIFCAGAGAMVALSDMDREGKETLEFMLNLQRLAGICGSEDRFDPRDCDFSLPGDEHGTLAESIGASYVEIANLIREDAFLAVAKAAVAGISIKEAPHDRD